MSSIESAPAAIPATRAPTFSAAFGDATVSSHRSGAVFVYRAEVRTPEGWPAKSGF